MGEEAAAKQEEVKSAETKPEEKPIEEPPKEEKPAAEEPPKEAAEEPPKEEPKPPSPVVLFVDLHCVGCAKKIERSIMKIRGVEGVVIDMAANQVTVKGIVDPQAICVRIQKKTKRRAKVLSPLPAAEGEPIPQVVTSQVSGLVTVELNVNMHCEACALQLKKKILKMRGVQTVETELSTGKVTVTGTMDAERLVDYVYRRTKKQARIVPQPEPEPVKEEEKKEEEKPAEEAAKPEEEKKDENGEKKEEEKPAEEEKKEGDNENKETNGGDQENGGDQGKEEPVKEGDHVGIPVTQQIHINEETLKKMMYYYPHPYVPQNYYPPPFHAPPQQYYPHPQPNYVIERVHAPQIFSDENPNACCIS